MLERLVRRTVAGQHVCAESCIDTVGNDFLARRAWSAAYCDIAGCAVVIQTLGRYWRGPNRTNFSASVPSYGDGHLPRVANVS